MTQIVKTADGARGVLIVEQPSAELATGLASFSFTVTIVAPDMTTTTAAAVSEATGKPGLYYFDVPSSFFTTNGTGAYTAVIEVLSFTNPVIFANKLSVFQVYVNDQDDTFNLGQAILGSVV